MLTQKKALLLCGSPKVKDSVSDALGSYVMSKLQAEDWGVQKFRANLVMKVDFEAFYAAVREADVIVISFPLYVDGLPAPLIRIMERIKEGYREQDTGKEQRLLAIANCGFPEAFHNDAALRICKSFAEVCGFQWIGGLATGTGPAMVGQSIKAQGMTQRIAQALDLAAAAIINNSVMAPEASQLMSSKMMPKRLYTFIGSLGWRYSAKKFKAYNKLYAKPYKKE